MTAEGHATASDPIAADPKSALEDLRQLFNAVPEF